MLLWNLQYLIIVCSSLTASLVPARFTFSFCPVTLAWNEHAVQVYPNINSNKTSTFERLVPCLTWQILGLCANASRQSKRRFCEVTWISRARHRNRLILEKMQGSPGPEIMSLGTQLRECATCVLARMLRKRDLLCPIEPGSANLYTPFACLRKQGLMIYRDHRQRSMGPGTQSTGGPGNWLGLASSCTRILNTPHLYGAKSSFF